jgi:hypothetical protein
LVFQQKEHPDKIETSIKHCSYAIQINKSELQISDYIKILDSRNCDSLHRSILLLALSSIKDLHVKCSSTMIVEHQESPLMKIMVFSKARPATLEKHITFTIVVYFYFIWGSITRHLL